MKLVITCVWLVCLGMGMGMGMGMAQVTFPCNDDGVDQSPINKIAFIDLGDNPDQAPFDSSLSTNGMTIDTLNPQDLWYDTARYKRERDYTIPSMLTWHVPNGFNSISAQVYYSLNDFDSLGSMRYEISHDGSRWFNVEAVTEDNYISRSVGVATNPSIGFEGYWFNRHEQAALPYVYTYFRAIWPAACADEINSDVRACVSISDDPEAPHRYFAPQLGELVLENGRDFDVPAQPEHIRMRGAYSSVSVEWDAASSSSGVVSGYVVYFMSAPNASLDTDYEYEHRNVGDKTSIKLDNLDTDTLYVVRIAAYNQQGQGSASPAQWISTSSSLRVDDTCSSVPTASWSGEPDWVASIEGVSDFSSISHSLLVDDGSDSIVNIHFEDRHGRCGYVDALARPNSFWPCPSSTCCSAQTFKCGAGIQYCNAQQIQTPTGTIIPPTTTPSPASPVEGDATTLTITSPRAPSVIVSGESNTITWMVHTIEQGQDAQNMQVQARVVGTDTILGSTTVAAQFLHFTLNVDHTQTISIELISNNKVLGTSTGVSALNLGSSGSSCPSCSSGHTVWQNLQAISSVSSVVSELSSSLDIVTSLDSVTAMQTVFVPILQHGQAHTLFQSRYNYVQQRVLTTEMDSGSMLTDSLYAANLGPNHFQKVALTKTGSEVVVNDNSVIVIADIVCSNGVIQVVSMPIQHPPTIQTLLQDSTVSSVLPSIEALGGSGITVFLPNVDPAHPWTPEAFNAHVITSLHYTEDLQSLAQSGTSLTSSSSNVWSVSSLGGHIYVGGSRLMGTQLLVDNGVVHVIDSVLVQPDPASTSAPTQTDPQTQESAASNRFAKPQWSLSMLLGAAIAFILL